MEELIKLLTDWSVDTDISLEDIKHWLSNYTKGGEITIDKKIDLANAIIEEASFNDAEIDLNNITHQLGTVWAGDSFIQTFKTEKPGYSISYCVYPVVDPE